MIFKNIILSVVVLLVLISCKDERKISPDHNQIQKTEIAENLKKVEVEIEGMTCEIGCARLIESKLSKTKGIKFVDVNFEKKLGMIEYDTSKIDEKHIEEVIKNIAGGDLYRVTKSTFVDNFSEIQ